MVGGETGMTRDVSTTGVYFHASNTFTPGTSVEFSLPLPRLAEAGLQMQCRGVVVRVEAESAGYGVAATIDRFSLTPSDQPARYFR
jgi:hypothetical protein